MLKVLFIGGTGVISSACTRLAVSSGLEVYLLNRGQSKRAIPEGVKVLIGDIRKPDEIKRLIEPFSFDAVVDWLAFEPSHIEIDIDLFLGKTKQFVFISSASAYSTPTVLPVTEENPIGNPFWEYSQKKIACEELLKKAAKEKGFPVTVVRPSHTYDETMLPITGRYTVVNRMLQGKKVIVHGDGTSLWTLTNHVDFAKGFVPLLGNIKTFGEHYHITSDEWLPWNQIFEMVAAAFNTTADIIHIPSDFIKKHDAEWGAGLLGDKSVSMIFDNKKIKKIAPNFKTTVPFSEGVKQIADWFNADPSRKTIDEDKDQIMDKIIEEYKKAY